LLHADPQMEESRKRHSAAEALRWRM
jgi:hypothetical protein